MKTEELDHQQEIQMGKVQQKKTKKTKAQVSKASKGSNAPRSRRRPQADSSQQNLLPQIIPQSSGTDLIITQGFQNQITKVVVTMPYSQLNQDKYESSFKVTVQTIQIMYSIQKQLDNIIVFAKLGSEDQNMKQKQNVKYRDQKQEVQLIEQDMIQISEQIQIAEDQQFVSIIQFWGKYVYLSGSQNQNKGFKKIRKQLSTIKYAEIVKFKIKQPISDLFICLSMRVETNSTTQFKGLVNQGSTCYMNSYLQTLYHIPALRNLVYQAEIQDQSKFPATLQELFFNLTHSEKAVPPDSLVKSFGWSKKEASIQQDVQQFSCLFFQALQKKLNASAPINGYESKRIDQLFKGSLNHYIRCTNVGTVIYYTEFSNQIFEEFIDLQLPIQATLAQALDSYTSEVHLQGQNAYYTEPYGKQQAYKGKFLIKKGVKIYHLPPILMIQLKRFQYDPIEDKNVKILRSLEYQKEMDFSEWSISEEKQEYQLYAVLVHQGSRAESGHYYNYVKQGETWFKFNDDIVQQVPQIRALKYNFGGHHESFDFDTKQLKVTKKFMQSKTTAYILVYIKKSLKDQLLFDNNKLPEWIMKKNAEKIKSDEEKKRKKLYYLNTLFIDFQEHLKGKDCADVGFLDDQIFLNSSATIPQILKEMKVSQWLISQNIIKHPIYEDFNEPFIAQNKTNHFQMKEQNNKKSQRSKKISQDNVEQQKVDLDKFQEKQNKSTKSKESDQQLFYEKKESKQNKTIKAVQSIQNKLQENLNRIRMSEQIVIPNDEQKPQQNIQEKSEQKTIQRQGPGLYLYYATTDRQILVGFFHKQKHRMIDLLKICQDPTIFKAPIQVMKDQYLGIVKKYTLYKQDDQVKKKYVYEGVIAIKKQTTYPQISQILQRKYAKMPAKPQQGQVEDVSKFNTYNYYIDDIVYGLTNLQKYTGVVPLPTPKHNQLLVCIVEEITFELSLEEEIEYSFPKYYEVMKSRVPLVIYQFKPKMDLSSEQKNGQFLQKQFHSSTTLQQLRQTIFDHMSEDKQKEYQSADKIIIKAKKKKLSKTHTVCTQPEYKTVKDLVRVQDKIYFCNQAAITESQLPQSNLIKPNVHLRLNVDD